MNPEIVSIKLSRFVHLTKLNKLLMFILLSYILVFSAYSLMNFPFLDFKNNIYGFTTDVINLIVIVAIFWVVQCSKLAKKAYFYVSTGLLLWIVGITADVLDEVVIPPYWVSLYVEDLCRTIGMTITAFGLFKTMLFMQKMHNRLAKELIMDDLTNVHNRRCFYRYVKNVTTPAYTLLIIDIDHFKSINDDFGHDMGDKILKEFAYKVNALFDDTSIFARIGGEEFAGYFPPSNINDVTDFSQTILELAHTINVKNDRFITVSIGIAQRIERELFDEVMKRADLALYKAKETGRNRYVVS
ncbi:diguanylate cyclase [Pseudoalteromonas fuliginea]|uniref:diguanylate cyclase n=2 Tax=Pseudoalteromonas fuliginea TaxID=1872678 RepID=A0ABD3YC89_9GAMM|nr:GGDEF domain-containing protein [Pseudoalteromonas fuliginea]KDC51479.1 diguanylate cyclase [Pseudoalteromonas sp. S3431]KDC52483.1 diguanylate cyclase [Pseudoalteromonas fuliginea]KJZ28236.1 diguanylate cyclase [Pseudoalteromonas fuliginea]